MENLVLVGLFSIVVVVYICLNVTHCPPKLGMEIVSNEISHTSLLKSPVPASTLEETVHKANVNK
ncbi:hypothetical protein J1N35_000403 [Gossypium stocksii]|uniref:Uncharacterized protein n=1 Tax=Gossypium stocksii TaxID=47602 RepID=A0A9D3WH57_9ROSI|nr:hypothetical protein J1N35_000403 [Gossypium stocksii]